MIAIWDASQLEYVQRNKGGDLEWSMGRPHKLKNQYSNSL